MAIQSSTPNKSEDLSLYLKSYKPPSKPLDFTNLTYEQVKHRINLDNVSYHEIIGEIIDDYWEHNSAPSLKSSLWLLQLTIVVAWLGFLKPITRILAYYIRN